MKDSDFFIGSDQDLGMNELETVIKSLSSLIIMLDRNGTYLKITPGHQQLYKPDEYRIGKNLHDILPFETAELIQNKIVEALTLNKPVKAEYCLPVEGRNKWFLSNIIPVSGEKVMLVRTDVTEMKLLQDELLRQKELAEEMNRLKSYFLANMSHELRTPMTGILGFSEVLAFELTDEDLREKARIINDSGRRLLETMNLILDLAKVESNLSEIKLSEFDVLNTMKYQISSFKPLAHKKGLFINLVAESESIKARLDRNMLSQIIKNLLSNAVKYTLSGGITVKVGADDDAGKLCIQITDSGIGIPPEHQEKIFEPFRQVSEGINRSHEGLGLGLTLVKKYVELLKGEISFVSQVGTGTIFNLLFPLREYPENGNNRPGAVNPVSMSREVNTSGIFKEPVKKTAPSFNVLFVEDDPTNQSVIKLFLKQICETDTANCSDAALQMVSKKKYDLILMDINLGEGKSGIETTQILRQIAGYENVPVVAVTAYAASGDKEYILNNGFDYYIAKPFTRMEIIDLVKNILSRA